MLGFEQQLTGADFRTARYEVFRIVGRTTSVNGKGHSQSKTASQWRSVATYTYTDESNQPLFRVIRRERGEGDAREKRFHQERFDGGRWVKGLGNVRRVPYRLAEVIQADEVFLVEGEKNCETLRGWGLVASTCPMGAGKWSAEYTPHFAGKKVVIIADADLPGRAHAIEEATAILGVAASVRVLELPDLPPKGDVTDFECAGGTRERLLELVGGLDNLDAAAIVEFRKRSGIDAEGDKSKGHRVRALQFPFQVSDEGVYFLKEGDEGTEPVRLAARVDVVAKTRDVASENWGRLLRWRDDERHLHQWAMPMELLASDAGAVRARLLSEGLPFIATNPRLRERFAEYLQTVPVTKRVRCVVRVGWHGDTYVLPDLAIGPESGEEMLYQTPHEATHYWNVRGTDDEWRENVGRRCSGNSRLIIAASSGFAGPILSLVGAESGGVHFHGGTSTGKSTTLVVGGSVCGGGGQAGFVQTWRATTNGLEAIAEAHNDGTLFLDELAQADPRDAAETAYILGNGQGKARMTRSIGARRKLTWNLLYVSAGELTLAEHSASAGKPTKGGAEVRLLNIEADAGQGLGLFENLHGTVSPDAFAREMKEAARCYYGAAFRAFLKHLTRDRAEVEGVVRAAREKFIRRFAPAGATGELKRAADRLALIGAAGELATGWDLTGWREGEALEAAERCFKEWVKGRGTTGASDIEAAIRQVRAFLEANGGSRFQRLTPASPETATERIINRAGFKRVSSSGETEYIILREVFRMEVCRGYSRAAVLKELDRRGFLVREKSNMTIKPRLPELGSVRVYCIRAAILDGDEW